MTKAWALGKRVIPDFFWETKSIEKGFLGFVFSTTDAFLKEKIKLKILLHVWTGRYSETGSILLRMV